MRKLLPFAVLLSLLAGCTHLKGIVVDESTGRPVPDAVFTVGRPTGVGVSDKFYCDAFGHFDFSIFPTDEEYLFVWDGKGDPEIAPRKIQKTEMGTDMRIKIHQAMPGPQ